MSMDATLRDRLRALRVFGGELPRFDTDATPDEPLALLVTWLNDALDAGVSQPHAMSLSTAGADGIPDSRTLLLKDVNAEGVWFASLSSGPKGRQIAENPHAALLLYWREQGRQIRIAGRVEAGPRDVSESDFLARSANARASAIAGEQSEPVVERAARVNAAREKIAAEPGYVPGEWVAYRVIPNSVEFWQAERERDQVRLRYLRQSEGGSAGNQWTRDILWP